MKDQLTTGGVWLISRAVNNFSVFSLNEWIKQPEFDVLYVCFVKVNFGSDGGSNAGPTFPFIKDTASGIEARQIPWIELIVSVIIHSALVGEISNIKDLFKEHTLRKLSEREDLFWTNGTYIVILKV